MPTMVKKERVVPSTRIEDRLLTDENPRRFYSLEKQSTYLWNVVEITVQNNKVVFVSRDVPTLKEIKVEKLMDLIESGGILNEADR